MSYTDLVRALPTSQKWSYAVEIQGFPWVYDDGLVAWGGVFNERTTLPGTLRTRDWMFLMRSDPKEPLTVGDGVTIDLVDDGTDIVFETFAEDYEGEVYGRLTETLAPGGYELSYELDISSPEDLSAYLYLFVGSETILLDVDGAGPGLWYINERGKFDTVAREHRVMGSRGPRITSSPTTFEGRVVTVWQGLVDATTGLLDAETVTPIWAGALRSCREVSEVMKLSCDPLTSLMTSGWPSVLPSATLGLKDAGVTLSAQDYYMVFGAWEDETQAWTLPLGKFVSGSGYTLLDPIDNQEIMLSEYVEILDHTLKNFIKNDPRSVYDIHAYTRIFVEPSNSGQKEQIKAHLLLGVSPNAMTFSIQLPASVGLGAPWRIPAHFVTKVFSFDREGTFVNRLQTTLRVKMDRVDLPFEADWTAPGEAPVGFAVIGGDDTFEVIRFTTVTVDAADSRVVVLSGVTRGYGGTEARVWGAEEDEDGNIVEVTGEDIVVRQMLAVAGRWPFSGPQDLPSTAEVLLYLMVSTETLGYHGAYDRLNGFQRGLSIPPRWVDIDSFRALADRVNLPKPNAFWLQEVGKGKEGLEELMKFAGVYFTTRRFIDADGFARFGFVLQSIDLPLTTAPTLQMTDAQLVSGSRPEKDLNERVTVNVTKIKPFSVWGGKESKGREITNYYEWSLQDGQPQKMLEFKPSAMYSLYDNRQTGGAYSGIEAQAAILADVSQRWYSAFGRASYKIAADMVAPYGWAYSIGDWVSINLVGVRSLRGSVGITAVGQITRLEQRHGARAICRLQVKVSIENYCELAPSARLYITNANTLTAGVEANRYSKDYHPAPFTGAPGAKDLQWFDVARHEGPFEVQLWRPGKFGEATIFTITATDLAAGTLTTSGSPSLTATFGGGMQWLCCRFRPYSVADSTDLQKRYAYVSADGKSLDSTEEPKDYS